MVVLLTMMHAGITAGGGGDVGASVVVAPCVVVVVLCVGPKLPRSAEGRSLVPATTPTATPTMMTVAIMTSGKITWYGDEEDMVVFSIV